MSGFGTSIEMSDPRDDVQVVVTTSVTVKDRINDRVFVVSSMASGKGMLPDETMGEAILGVADVVAKQCCDQARKQRFIQGD